ncbi:MAG: hypothetical protein AAF541_17500 [Pseudomonadota bacterium]
MKLLKWVGGIVAFYVVFVILFETVYLGFLQPSFEEQGIPMLVLTTRNGSGDKNPRMLANMSVENKIYVSAHHWPRGWYDNAIDYPQVEAEIDGINANYVAVPVSGSEFENVAAAWPLGFVTRFLMGFPPEREILRLDPAAPDL